MADPTALKIRIEGMDCAACAQKIENAIDGLPGVSDLNVSYGLRRLTLSLDEDRTARDVVEAKVKALGFTPVSPPENSPASGASHDVPDQPEGAWWKSTKARQVFIAGALLALAYSISYVQPAWSFCAYSAAALAGLLPIARHALAGITSGTPFSIETLMTVAAVGAVAIGEAGKQLLSSFSSPSASCLKALPLAERELASEPSSSLCRGQPAASVAKTWKPFRLRSSPSAI